MVSFFRILLILAPCLSLSAKEADGWLKTAGPMETWDDALPVSNKQRAVLVLDSPATTRLRGAMITTPPAAKPDAGAARTNGLLEIFKKETTTLLTIDWLGEIPGAAGFKRATHPADGRVRSVSRIGTTTITRTVVCSRADDAVFIHLIANQPGALSFKVTLDTPAGGKIRMEDRRQLILTPPEGLASHVWVLPFESDVKPDGDSIVVHGEGEALIVWAYGVGAEGLSGTLQQLARRYDPEDTPANPAKIWQGVLASHLKSVENSP